MYDIMSAWYDSHTVFYTLSKGILTDYISIRYLKIAWHSNNVHSIYENIPIFHLFNAPSRECQVV